MNTPVPSFLPSHSIAALPISPGSVGIDRRKCADIAAGPVVLRLLDRFGNSPSTPREPVSHAFAIRFPFADMLLYRVASGKRVVQWVVDDALAAEWKATLGEEKIVAGSLARYRVRISASPETAFTAKIALAADGRIHFTGEVPRHIGFKADERYRLSFEPAEDEWLAQAMAETNLLRAEEEGLPDKSRRGRGRPRES